MCKSDRVRHVLRCLVCSEAEHHTLVTGADRVSLVVYDGLPQDSIIETPVGAVVQSTRQGVGRQIATMVRRLIAGEDLASLQVLWQPEFIPGETA